MSTKKESKFGVSPEDEALVEQLLAQYHQIATNLHSSENPDEAEAALDDIHAMPESAQMALLKALSKEQNSDAADVLLALNELSPDKAMRKEARRGLIRLEGAKVYPRWEPPATRTLMVPLVRQPPRYWRGYVTQVREEGEVQLVLIFEEGYEYNETRMFIFLLDFWEQGVKDFFIQESNKRSVEEQIRKLQSQLPDVTLADVTLAEGRRLIEDALSVNKWRGTTPHKEYRHHLPTINQLILEAENVGQDRGQTFISPQLEPDEIAGTFVGGWALGDYGLNYDMLSRDSRLREGLERNAWIEKRRAWANEARPTRFELSMVRERPAQEAPVSALWVPSPSLLTGRGSTRKEVELAWSLEVSETPLSGTLPEMPMGTIVYKETGRHWYWSLFTLVQEDGQWRIQSISDEGATIQGLPIEELQKRVDEQDALIQEITQNPVPPDTEEAQKNFEEIVTHLVRGMYYDDALIAKLPLDQHVYEDAYSRAITLNNFERAAAYVDRIAQRFGQGRGEILQRLGILQATLADWYLDRNLTERSEHFYALAEATLNQSLDLTPSVAGHARLAEILFNHHIRLDEAETHLNQARELAASNANRTEEAMVEVDLAQLAVEREQYERALQHFQRAAELNPAMEGIWFNIGMMQRILKRFDDAEATYKHAIEVEPRDFRTYSELTAIYMNQRRYAEARQILEQGLRVIPNSAHLRALLSSVFLETGDRRRAQAMLDEAERLDPENDIVKAMREEMNRARKR
ncbi:MAG TPA: tetratricopeptide repeat protein [Ktedonobacteraceae bacterium]|nr:tetratricopeptide repeat protein [Ktedonobacteraceae bacterium]